jgi:hypothetical protein
MAIKIRPGSKHNPKKKGYYYITGDTPEDVKAMRGSDIVKQIREKGVSNLEKQFEDQRQGETVLYPNGKRLRMGTNQAEQAVNFMRRRCPKGPPPTTTRVSIGARIVTMKDGTKRVVRDYEEK